MKKLQYIIILMTLVSLPLISSGVTKKSNSSRTSTFPITFTAECLTFYGGGEKLPLDTKIDPEGDYSKDVYEFTLYKDGSYKGTKTNYLHYWGTSYTWKAALKPVTYEGTWTETYRIIGKNRQKVYKLRVKQGYLDGYFYVPANFKFIWLGGDEWKYDDTKPSYAIQITNIK